MSRKKHVFTFERGRIGENGTVVYVYVASENDQFSRIFSRAQLLAWLRHALEDEVKVSRAGMARSAETMRIAVTMEES
jgi:hypothetical protein